MPASSTPCTPRDRVIRSPGCDGPIATATAARAATLGPRAPSRHRGAVRNRAAESHYRTALPRAPALRRLNQPLALSRRESVNVTSVAFVAVVGPLFLLSSHCLFDESPPHNRPPFSTRFDPVATSP